MVDQIKRCKFVFSSRRNCTQTLTLPLGKSREVKLICSFLAAFRLTYDSLSLRAERTIAVVHFCFFLCSFVKKVKLCTAYCTWPLNGAGWDSVYSHLNGYCLLKQMHFICSFPWTAFHPYRHSHRMISIETYMNICRSHSQRCQKDCSIALATQNENIVQKKTQQNTHVPLDKRFAITRHSIIFHGSIQSVDHPIKWLKFPKRADFVPECISLAHERRSKRGAENTEQDVTDSNRTRKYQ